MTNAPEGRTYFDYRWELKSSLTSFQLVNPKFPEDYDQIQTPVVVPNGKWVMERPAGWAWLVGITPDELETFCYTDKFGVRHSLRICQKPFGFITAEEEDVDQTVYPPVIKPSGRKTLVCAQQIHRSELGQTVPIPKLSAVRQAFAEGEKPNVVKPRERRRSNLAWVRLSELSDATSLSAEVIIFGYWGYSGHRNSWFYHNDQEGGQLLDIVLASTPDGIRGKTPVVHSFTQAEAKYMFTGRTSNFLWVRRGFANTFLRLRALHVAPDEHPYLMTTGHQDSPLST